MRMMTIISDLDDDDIDDDDDDDDITWIGTGWSGWDELLNY